MVVSKFIASRATARTLLNALSSLTPSSPASTVVAPCDFRKLSLPFKVRHNKVMYQNFEMPIDTLESTKNDNESYEVVIKAGNKEMELLPLTIPSQEGIVFKLTEPETDLEVEGPILYLHNLKMHLTKGYPSVMTFPRQLAEAAQVKKNSTVLDLFFGLGYCTQSSLEMGASKVVSFEMYKEVLQLASKNPFSPKLNDPRELTRKGFKYDACIIDPAKKKVMEKVYTTSFLESLSAFIIPGAHVAAYVPDGGIAQKFKDMRANIVTTFEATKKFKYVGKHKDSDFIFTFVRKNG